MVVEGHDIADIQVLSILPSVTTVENGSVDPKTSAKQVTNSPTRQPLADSSPSSKSIGEAVGQPTNIVNLNALSIKTREPRKRHAKHEIGRHPTAKNPRTPPTSTSSKNSFTDPAILSIRKAHSGSQERHTTPLSQAESLVSATLSGPFHSILLSEIPIGQEVEDEKSSPHEHPDSLQDGLKGNEESKKRRRRKRKKPEAGGKLIAPTPSSLLPINATLVKPNGHAHSAFLAQADRTSGAGGVANDGKDQYLLAKSSTVKVRQKSRHTREQRETSEWEAEDASNIQKMPEFDFAANLSKFDKHSVFSQFKNDDTTADEARLVGHNRMPRPGTNGGRNLHFSENVLDAPRLTPKPGKWSSEAGESELEGVLQSSPSIHMHRPPSSSKKDHDQPQSATSNRRVPTSRSMSSTRTRSMDRILTLTPLQSVEAEAFAVSHIGLSEDIMTENAARGIAEVVMHDLKDRAAAIKQPQMIIFAGNHKTGARAISAGRHLLNHGVQVVTAVLDANDGFYGRSNENLLPAVRQAIFSFRKSGGKVFPVQTLFRSIESPSFRPHVFLDAVHGIHLQHRDLSPNAQAHVVDLLEVFQDSGHEEHVLSIDVPLGRDPITGKVTIGHDKSSLHWPQHAIFLGTPKPWREAVFGIAGDETEKTMMLQGFKSWVVDLGFNFAKSKGGFGRSMGGWGQSWVEELDIG